MASQTIDALASEQIADLREIGEDLAQCLRDLRAGKDVIVGETIHGRNIVLAVGGFAVQPRGDNYWITVPTIDDAMRASM